MHYDIVKSVWQSETLREEIPRFFSMEESEHMPYRSNIPCKHPDYAALITHDQMYCDEHKKLHKSDRAYASERGYGGRSGSVREGSF